jgi:hypothetical protein
MVANLRAGNIDGFLGPDPFNQRAVFEEVGFIHLLTKDLWDGHPCCAFGTSPSSSREPQHLRRAVPRVLTAAAMAREPKNRELIAKVIAPQAYLNQPETVVAQVLTGKFADGLGNVQNVPDRADFDPMPWQSMAVWMLTQMKRWGYVKGDVNYKQIAEKVFLLTDAKKQMKELGQKVPDGAYPKFKVMGKVFDPEKPAAYLDSFAISKRLRWPADERPDARRWAAKAALLSLLLLLLLLGVWHLATLKPAAARRRGGGATLTPEQIEYAKLMGKDPAGRAATAAGKSGFPTLAQMGAVIVQHLSAPSTTTAPTTRASACSWRTRWAAWRWATCWRRWWPSRWAS